MALDPERLQKPLKKVRKQLKKMASGPEDIHKFRTNCRRIETTLRALDLAEKGSGRRVSKRIAKLRKRAGKVRDMDVLTEYLIALDRPDSERQCHTTLIENLGAKRRKQVKKLYKIRNEYSPKLTRNLRRIAKKIRKATSKIKNSDGKAGKTRDAGSRAAARALFMISKLQDPARLQKSNLHEYRIKVKELRNLLKMEQSSDHQHFVQILGQVKDAIGEWHDWQELGALAQSILDHGKNCRLLEELHATGRAKYDLALNQAQNMRKMFLLSSDSGVSKGIQNRIAKPMLSVVAGLAA